MRSRCSTCAAPAFIWCAEFGIGPSESIGYSRAHSKWPGTMALMADEVDKESLERQLREEGFANVYYLPEPPGAVYSEHVHRDSTTRIVVEGEITIIDAIHDHVLAEAVLMGFYERE